MDKEQLSKIISFALRHNPTSYSLKLDEFGWVNLKDLYNAILNKHVEYSSLSIQHFIEVINTSEKKRHEIKGDTIRALHGHSRKIKINKPPVKKPPKKLYHGTPQKKIKEILKLGLLPMSRKFVHLSDNYEEAKQNALRFSNEIVILMIDAERAYNDNVLFYNENTTIWLVDKLDVTYLSIV